MAAAARPLGGVEVPIPGGDKIEWAKVSVPSSFPPTPSTTSSAAAALEPRDSAAGCHTFSVESTAAYLIWRIHKDQPNVLEVMELFPSKVFPGTGLRLVFQDEIHPFAFIYMGEMQRAAETLYLLYAMTLSGVAYLLQLRSPSSYISGSVFPHNELVELDVQAQAQNGHITAVTAVSGSLVIGRQDGSIGCYRLGIMEPSAPGFFTELRDDMGIGRLWNLVSRGKAVGAVRDVKICELCGRKLLFALHSNEVLRVWDMASHAKVFTHHIHSCDRTEADFSALKLWVGDADYDSNMISLATLHGYSTEVDLQTTVVLTLSFIIGNKLVFSSEVVEQSIPVEEGRIVDVKLRDGKCWIIKQYDSMLYDLIQTDCELERTFYSLQEDFVADQLFQSSEQNLDDLIWTNDSIFSLLKDQTAYFVSSIFLRRLLQPGVHHSTALRATILDYKKYFSDYEFHSLTTDGLKKEIFSAIVGEGIATNSTSMIYYWKSFCSHFFRHWCESSTPYGLFVDSNNGVVGLIRKSSISIFRSLEGVEQLTYGTGDGLINLRGSDFILPDTLDCEILLEVLRCMSNINCQFGKASAAVFYESLVSPVVSSEDILFQLLKMMDTGCSPLTSLEPHLGADCTWQKKQAVHKSQRKFAVDMLLACRSLQAKSSSWPRVLDVIEKYAYYLIPFKSKQKFNAKGLYNINSTILVQATAQATKMMFESAFNVLLLLGYLVNLSGQVQMIQSDVARVQLKLIPMVHEIISQWLVLHFLATTPSAPLTMDDFSSRLSLLHIEKKMDKIPWSRLLGLSDVTLVCLLDFPYSGDEFDFLCSGGFPSERKFSPAMRNFISSVVWGVDSGNSYLSSSVIELACILLRHSQYEAAENIFHILDAYLSKRTVLENSQSSEDNCFARLHLLGFCLLLRVKSGLCSDLKDQKIHEAVRCFFRAASVEGAAQSLQKLNHQTGFECPVEFRSTTLWRLHYYQWVMQMFEQYGLSEAACQFALAALEQVDDVLSVKDGHGSDGLQEPESTIKGRLWANVFKFTLDLKYYRDSYCAIVSNPDEESKYICLRRFVNVLCELGTPKILCDGQVPFLGLSKKVEVELAWKAERADISLKPNLYKVLYAYESRRNNWRKAASCMYRYSERLRTEATLSEGWKLSSALQERLHGIAAAINSLQLVDPAFAWFDAHHEDGFCLDQDSPNKRARTMSVEKSSMNCAMKSRVSQCYIDIESLQKEYALTSAEYLLASANVTVKYSGNEASPTNLVDGLVHENFYDMAFTLILKFWKGSELKRELERAFTVISEKCCPDSDGSLFKGSNRRGQNYLLPPSNDGAYSSEQTNTSFVSHHVKGNSHWETLEFYLDKYKKLNPRLLVTVAETLLRNDSQIELPLWLVHMFKGGKMTTSWGMTGQESDPAALFRLYVDYGRCAEATNLLLEFLDSFASRRPVDLVNRKKMSSVWFPYTAVERLWCQLEELQNAGHMADQCGKLKGLIETSLMNHLRQVKIDSDDAVEAASTHCPSSSKLADDFAGVQEM